MARSWIPDSAFVDEFGRDCRLGARHLRRNPGFAAVAVLTLALGIGVSTAIFTVVDTVLFRPLPYHEPDRLVAVYEGSDGRTVVAWSEFTAFSESARTLEAVAAIQPVAVTLIEGDQPEQVDGALVSASLFPMLGIRPLLGRDFLPGEDRAGAGQAALLSERLWRSRYGADPGVVGRTIALDVVETWGRLVQRAREYTVVGVLPASFETLLNGTRGDVWLPLAATPEDSHDLFVVGRMRPGVTPEHVRSDLETITEPLRAATHSDGRAMRFRAVPVLEDLLGDWRRTLLVLLGAVGLVLLIACVNVANLVLASGWARRREMSTRAAMGAGRARLIRQVLAETALLALIGGGLGLLVAVWSLDLLGALGPDSLPRLDQARVDGRVFAFAAMLVLLSSLLSGLPQALRLSPATLFEALKQGGRGAGEGRAGRRLRGLTVVAEVALAMVLLVGGALMVRTLAGLMRVDPGFDPSGVMSFRISLPRHAYQTPDQRAGFYETVFERIRALPGVTAVGVNHALPFGGLSTGTRVSTGGGDEPIDARWQAVSPEYFRALGIPMLKGSPFQPGDMRGEARNAIVDPLLSRRLWGDADPVGRRIVLAGNPPFTVVGVAGTVLDSSLAGEGNPTVYVPIYPRRGAVVMRGPADLAPLVPEVRRILADVDRVVAPTDIRPMEERLADQYSLQRITALLLGAFSGAAALLGLIGLYGVVSFSVGQRTNEIGLRVAIGARRLDVLRLVLGQGLKLISAGILAGLAGAAALAHLLSRLLFGVSPTDPATYAGVAAAMAIVALLACYLPARRAARMDPVIALRQE